MPMCSTKLATVRSGFSRQPQVEKGSDQRRIEVRESFQFM